MNNQSTDQDGGRIDKGFLKTAVRDTLCLMILFACITAAMCYRSALIEPKHLDDDQVASLSQRVSGGLRNGAIAGASVGAIVGSGIVLLRMAKKSLQTTR